MQVVKLLVFILKKKKNSPRRGGKSFRSEDRVLHISTQKWRLTDNASYQTHIQDFVGGFQPFVRNYIHKYMQHIHVNRLHYTRDQCNAFILRPVFCGLWDIISSKQRAMAQCTCINANTVSLSSEVYVFITYKYANAPLALS